MLHWQPTIGTVAKTLGRPQCRHLRRAEKRGWQLDDQIRVSELGFGRDDVLVLDTPDVVAIWQGSLFA